MPQAERVEAVAVAVRHVARAALPDSAFVGVIAQTDSVLALATAVAARVPAPLIRWADLHSPAREVAGAVLVIGATIDDDVTVRAVVAKALFRGTYRPVYRGETFAVRLRKVQGAWQVISTESLVVEMS
jgi:hypothetical protein